MWWLGRLVPEHKTIAEFRRMHREGVTAAGAELVRLARSVGESGDGAQAMPGMRVGSGSLFSHEACRVECLAPHRRLSD